VILVSASARSRSRRGPSEAALALMRPVQLLMNGASIPDLIRHLRNDEHLIAPERKGIRLRRGSPLLRGGDASRCWLPTAQPL
jgi:hypothetical protein